MEEKRGKRSNAGGNKKKEKLLKKTRIKGGRGDRGRKRRSRTTKLGGGGGGGKKRAGKLSSCSLKKGKNGTMSRGKKDRKKKRVRINRGSSFRRSDVGGKKKGKLTDGERW